MSQVQYPVLIVHPWHMDRVFDMLTRFLTRYKRDKRKGKKNKCHGMMDIML